MSVAYNVMLLRCSALLVQAMMVQRWLLRLTGRSCRLRGENAEFRGQA